MPIASPLDIPGLLVWYSAEELEGADGSQITTWKDLSGNKNHATGASGASGIKPILRAAAGAAGGPAVHFTAAGASGGGPTIGDGYFTLPANLMGTLAAAEIAMTVRQDAAATRTGLWSINGVVNNTGQFEGTHYPWDGTVYDCFGLQNTDQRQSFAPSLAINTWRRYNVYSAPGDWQAFLDGVSQKTYALGTVTWNSDPLLGATSEANSLIDLKFQGWMGAVVIYNRKLTTTERADLDAWLAANPSGGVAPESTGPRILQSKAFGGGGMTEVSSLSWTLDTAVPAGATIVVIAAFGNGWDPIENGVPDNLAGLGASWRRVLTVPASLGVRHYRAMAVYVGTGATGGTGPITGAMSNTRYAARVFVLTEGDVFATTAVQGAASTLNPTISMATVAPGDLALAAFLTYDDQHQVTDPDSGDAPAPFTSYPYQIWWGGGDTDGMLQISSLKCTTEGPITHGITLNITSGYRALILRVRESQRVISWWDGIFLRPARMLGLWDGAALKGWRYSNWWDGLALQPLKSEPSPGPVASSQGLAGGEGALMVLDNNNATKWYAGTSSVWISFYSAAGRTKVATYEIVSGNDSPDRDPKNWTLSGSNDGGTTWTVIDTVVNQPMWGARNAAVTFTVDSPGVFRQYKWTVTATNGASFQASELRLFDELGAVIAVQK